MSNENEKDELTSEALYSIAKSLRLLGMGNIDRGDTALGAIEGLTMQVKESNEKIADSLSDVAEAIRELAQAVGSK